MALAESQFKQAVGRVMSGFRGELRYSQNRMGLLLGVGQRTVSEIESGKRMLTAMEVVDFPKHLAVVLPYTEDEIRKRLLTNPHFGSSTSGQESSRCFTNNVIHLRKRLAQAS